LGKSAWFDLKLCGSHIKQCVEKTSRSWMLMLLVHVPPCFKCYCCGLQIEE